ncbi:MAG: R3H domain-containing nucleic acid-binding protein [Candidatus Paceibacterota bacterium]|jgi:spoIIIJ-associated protein
MNEIKDIFEQMLRFMGFSDFSIAITEESRRLSVFLNEGPYLDRHIPSLVVDLEFLLKMIAKKRGQPFVFVDINNYRKNREDLIVKLARAAAKKSAGEKKTIPLPPMNAYERRLVHAELAIHPDIKTESEGEGKDRRVVIKPIE